MPNRTTTAPKASLTRRDENTACRCGGPRNARDLLRNLIDQQLWLSKGKELDITGETELVKRLDEIRKQANLESLKEDLEKAAKEQGVSFEDFKQNIRNQIIVQDVMRQEVGEHIRDDARGEEQRYCGEHKQDYAQPESERLSEILISTGTDDPAKVDAAKAKADDIEARLHSGGDFAQLAKSFSERLHSRFGQRPGSIGRASYPRVLEDKTFGLNSGQYTDPILTRPGYIIPGVVQHNAEADTRPAKERKEDVEQAYYMSLMDPRHSRVSESDEGPGYSDQTGIRRRRGYAGQDYTFQHQLQRL